MSIHPDHEKLEVYRLALDTAVELEAVAKAIVPARRDLRDQLRRASASILLNIAEGAGEFSGDEKARFYRMSRRSASECLAILDLLSRLYRPTKLMRDSKLRIIRIMSMLTKLARAVSSVPLPVPVPVPENARSGSPNNVP